MTKIFKSLKNINYKLFIALLLVGLVPTIYTTVRVNFLGDLPGDWAYSIAGQLSWVNLMFEIVTEAIILPLFFFIGKEVNDKKKLTNRVKTGMLITFGIYLLFSLIVIIFAKPLLNWMAASPDIIEQSETYIRIESVAYIFSTLLSFALVVLVSINKEKYLYIFTGLKLILCLLFDTFLVSSLPCSLNIGVNGIGVSNIIVNLILTISILFILHKEQINVINKEKMDFTWTKGLLKQGALSGCESFVRNLAYMVMICKMVNVVNEQGTYWVANNFIWGWLLLPITQLGELIKKDCATDAKAINRNSLGYFAITTIICLLWVVLIPLYKSFMSGVLNYDETEKLFSLVMILFGFYVFYSYQNIFDSTFYGIGKTQYMLFESLVTNTIYYGSAFILYKTGVWIPTLNGIALLFGIGVAFDSIVSLGAYIFLLKKHNINILDLKEVPKSE